MTGSLQPQLVSVHELFTNSLFEIPDYQRAYAWEQPHCKALWDDVREGMRTGTTHFLGTVVLMSQAEQVSDTEGRPLTVYDVVDGQQRLTSLSLLLLSIYEQARESNANAARGIWRDFIRHEDTISKLKPGGLNRDYFDQLIDSVSAQAAQPLSSRSTNHRVLDALKVFRDLLSALMREEMPPGGIVALAKYVRESLKILRFVTDSQALAIKMFQTVNDRGKDLSLLDKSKSFLMFYLTRYLSKDLEAFKSVESTFSKVFDAYDLTRDLATKYDIAYLIKPQFKFNENEYLRYAYHYGHGDLVERFGLIQGYEYSITPEQIFTDFIKKGCESLRDDAQKLRQFILAWCEDLLAVSEALSGILECIESSPQYKRFMQIQGPSGSVYPLLVSAKARGFLDDQMLWAIEVMDLRVYKVRNTDPKANLYRQAIAVMKKGSRDEIFNAITRYSRRFGSDQELQPYLQGYVYEQAYTKYVLWNYALRGQKDIDALDYDLYSECQVEHVFPQDESLFDAITFGFVSVEDYQLKKHVFGNLIPLEENLNKGARHKPPAQKVPYYQRSRIAENRVMGGQIEISGFRAEHQQRRTDEIISFFKRKWAIPEDAVVVVE